MADSLGKLNPGTTNLYKFGSGTDTDAAMRRSRNRFNLSTDSDPAGGTANALYLGRLREGQVPTGFRIASDANLSGINFTIGTKAAVAKYAAAFAGPAANAQVTPTMPIAAQMAEALTVPEDVYAFPSGNLAATGQVVTMMDYTHR